MIDTFLTDDEETKGKRDVLLEKDACYEYDGRNMVPARKFQV